MSSLGVKEVDKHEKYLGLPTMIGRSKKTIFSTLEERINKKLKGWKEKLLSSPGRETLIKAVSQAIPIYMMSCFRIPDATIDKLQAAMARFWWGAKGENRKVHWKSWSKLCLPKHLGGMGFRDLRIFNQALLARQAWRIYKHNDSLLAKVLKARYFKNGNLIDSNLGFNPSYTWRNIWGAKSLLMEGLRWRIGDGCSINVWREDWIPLENNVIKPSPGSNANLELRVKDLIDFNTMSWNEDTIKEQFCANQVEAILSIPLSIQPCPDEKFWWPTKNGIFTTKLAYWLGCIGPYSRWAGGFDGHDPRLWKSISHLKVPPKIKHFLWKASSNCLAVKRELNQRNITPSSLCPICKLDDESVIHALCLCPHTSSIWESFLDESCVNPTVCKSFASLLLHCTGNLDSNQSSSFFVRAWASWALRNDKIFNSGSRNPTFTLQCFLKYLEDFVNVHGTKLNRPCHPIAPSPSIWSPPTLTNFKVNTDAKYYNDGTIGLGVVIRDQRGEMVLTAARRVRSMLTVLGAELVAARWGLVLARDRGYTEITLESDSLQAVQDINQEERNMGLEGLLMDDIKWLLADFHHWSCVHVKRNGNILAHTIASYCSLINQEIVMSCNFPLLFTSIALNDVLSSV